MAESQGTSPWIYCGCGCFGCAGLAAVAMVVMGLAGASFFHGFVQDMADPEARTANVREILGAETLPAGYNARMYFRFPWVVDMAILTDAPVDDLVEPGQLDDFEPLSGEQIGDHVFIFLSVRGDGDDEIEDFWSGKRGRHGNVNVEVGARFEAGELLAEGALELEAYDLTYQAFAGELVTEDGQHVDGVYSQMRIDCPDRGRDRLALWFARGDQDLAEEDLPAIRGTPADEAALGPFMSHFDLCPSG